MTVHARQAVNPAGLMKFSSPVPQAMRVKADEYLFVAGQVALDENGNGNVVGAGDVAAQVRKIFQNIESVLKSAGATFDNIVDFTTYLVGRDAMEPFMKTRTELFQGYFPKGNYPPIPSSWWTASSRRISESKSTSPPRCDHPLLCQLSANHRPRPDVAFNIELPTPYP